MYWLAAFVVGAVAMYVLAPKVDSTPPAGIEDLKAPTAEDGREIPVLFGCRDLRAPNVVWYGDLRTTPIKAEGGKK
jgi:hypothetical protein